MSDIVLSASEVKALRDAVLINASGEAIGLDLPAIKRIIAERMAQAWDEGWDRAEYMARCWGHTDYWGEEPEYPTNPYR